jgi:hypothetical protein
MYSKVKYFCDKVQYIAASLTSYSGMLCRLSVMVVSKTLVQYVSFDPGSEHMKSCLFHTKLCSVRLISDLFCEGFIFSL